MTTEIHPGEVVHAMDHFVLDLATPDNTTAYFTIYSLGLMRQVGAGRVALLRVETLDGVIDRCFGDTVDLARRMQDRLKGIRAEGGPSPAVGIDHPPLVASIRRTSDERWLIESDQHTISASWSDGEAPFWLTAPAPAFHPTRDYATTFISYRQAELVVDGTTIDGQPYPHEAWEQRLGRPFSSCHVALAETAIEAP